MVLNGEGAEAPKIRIARPITAMPFEGTRKRRRAAMGEYTWSVGDRVDAWTGDRYAHSLSCITSALCVVLIHILFFGTRYEVYLRNETNY